MVHLKTLTVPRTWPIKRKGSKFVVRPKPGKQLSTSMPIALVFRSMLKYCKTMKEAKTILQDKEILVDGVRRKDAKYQIGLMDVLSVPISDEYYRMSINTKNKLVLRPIDKKESGLKIVKILGKTALAKDKLQLNLSDGRNILVKSGHKVGDSLLIELPSQKIAESLEMKEGNTVFLTGGNHIGQLGKITKLGTDITVKLKDTEVQIPKKYVYVVGKDKPLITLAK